MDRWWSKRQVARWFGVSVRTVERWMRRGLPYLRLGPTSKHPVRFRREDVERWLDPSR